MDAKLIERLRRRICFSMMEITSEVDEISKAMEGLVELSGSSQEAKSLGLRINDAGSTIEDEITEILGTLAWFEGRVASEGKKNG